MAKKTTDKAALAAANSQLPIRYDVRKTTLMKNFFTIACLLAAANLAPYAGAQTPQATQSPKTMPASTAPAPDCATAATQARMNECAYEDFLDANAGYAESYKTLAGKMSATQKDQFRRTQKLWIQYRTAACNFESSGVAGGSARPMVKWQCDARMTRARTAELTALANCKEGDLSCPRFTK